MNNKPSAAIWCRVSTHDQRELSLDSQELAVRRVLETNGYDVPDWAVLKTDWTSLDLLSCPEFQCLRRWVSEGSVGAVGVLDRDRLQAQGLQRLIFLSECQEQNVVLITAQGPAPMEGGEGQLVELALALGKERSVLRAQQGARDGLRDRVRLKGLPASGRSPLGYRWYVDEAGRHALVPTPAWIVADRIWKMYLSGETIRGVARRLSNDGVPTAKGRAAWEPSTIAGILKCPTYAGRYYALRWERTEPKARRSPSTYGKTSTINKSTSWTTLDTKSAVAENTPLLDIKVERQVVSWKEFLWVQQRLQRNQEQSRRRAKGEYFLRGMVTCMACGKSMGGAWNNAKGKHRYACSGCTRTRSGPALEEAVWGRVTRILQQPDLILSAVRERDGLKREEVDSLNEQLRGLAKKEAENLAAEQGAFRILSRGHVRQEVYDKEMALVK